MEGLFSDKEWIGEFFPPEQFEGRFLGRVSFSPEKGIVLSYNIGLNPIKVRNYQWDFSGSVLGRLFQ